MKILRKIAKHAAIIVLPEAFFLGILAAITVSPDSWMEGGRYGKRAGQVILGGCAVMYALYLIYYYFKFIEEKCRAPREVEFVEMQPVRMRPVYHRFPRHAPPNEILPTNGHRNQENRQNEEVV